MRVDMSTAGGKLTGLVLIFGGLICTILAWKIFKNCVRIAAQRGKSVADKLNLLLYCLPGIYLAAQALEIPFSLSDSTFKIVAVICLVLPTIRNLLKWGMFYGIGFSICQGLMSAVVYIAAYTLAFAAVLALAILICIVMSIPRGSLWIGLALVGGAEFLVMPMEDGRYHDSNANIYTKMGDNQLLGMDGNIYYVHRTT